MTNPAVENKGKFTVLNQNCDQTSPKNVKKRILNTQNVLKAYFW
jgi:hypothetical protein